MADATVLTDLQKTEQLKPGDACEFQTAISRVWHEGTVIENGGSYYWKIKNNKTGEVTSPHIESVRAPGTDPWKRWNR